MVEHLAEEFGEGHHPAPVVLGGSEMQIAADLCEALSDLEIASEHIDSASSQSDRLTPSQCAVSKHVDEGPGLDDLVRKSVDFRRAEKELLSPKFSGKIDTFSRVGRDVTRSNSSLEDLGENVMRLPDP